MSRTVSMVSAMRGCLCASGMCSSVSKYTTCPPIHPAPRKTISVPKHSTASAHISGDRSMHRHTPDAQTQVACLRRILDTHLHSFSSTSASTNTTRARTDWNPVPTVQCCKELTQHSSKLRDQRRTFAGKQHQHRYRG
eukprot:197-Rhodomonas_salina.1